jgi:type IV secretory pathway VirB6-like protein
MDTPKASVKKIALNYGLILALLSIVITVILFVTDNHIDRPWWSSLLSFLLMLAVIVYGLKAFKAANGGFMSLGEALKAGLAISLVAGIIGAIFNYLFVTVIEPDFVEKMLDFTRERMYEQNPNMTEEQAEMALSMSEKFMSPGIMSAFAVIGSLFFGFIISLIAGLIMKQNRPEH